MATEPPGKVTELLGAISDGSEDAKNRLFEVVYEELRRVATGLMHRERQDHTLQPTALVHEAYLKLFAKTELKAANRAHFFAAAANAMRQVLVDHARIHNAEIHGGKLRRTPFDVVLNWLERTQQLDMLDFDEALKTLEARSTRQHKVVMLRFFGGLTCEETASNLKVSVSTVEKDWQVARAWLYGQLKEKEK